MKLRLTSRIVLYFVLLATVLLAVVGVLSYRSGNESLKAAAISEMLAAAIEKEAALDTWIEGRLDDIVQISSPADVAEKAANLVAAAPASEEARLAHAIVLDELEPHLVGHRGAYIELFVMEPAGGKVVASTSPAEEGKFKLGHPYFDNGKTNLYLQAPYRSADMAAPAMTVAIPLRATDGRVVAVLAARVDLAVMNTIVRRRTGLRQTDDSFLFDAEQFLVTQPRFINEPMVLRRKLDTEAVRRCAARQSGVTLAPDYRGVPSIAVYRWNAKLQLGLIVKIDQAEALAAARAFGWSVFLISGLALFATVGLAFLLARTITRPLRTLHEGVRRFAGGGIREPLLESSCDEVGLLACEFNQMAARVAERTAELASVNEALKAENAERKRAELETQHQATFARFNPNPVLELSATGEITYFNEATGEMARALGCENPEQMLPANTAAMVRECLATNKPKLRAETQIGQRVISWSFFPVKFNHTVHCYAGDITERKRAEEALRASLQIIEGILNAMPVRVFWKDNNLVYLGCNATFARDAGFADPKDIIGKDDYQMGWRDQAELYRGSDRQVIESGCSKLLIEEPQTTPEGSTITLLSSKVPLRGSNGEVSGVLGMYMDITERKRAEEELRRTSELLLRTGELAKVGGWELDLRTMKVFWALQTCRIHEVDPPVAPALDQAINFYAPEARPVIQAAVQAGIDSGTPFDLDLPLITAKGRSIWVRAQGSAVMEGGKAVKLRGSFQDITERKRAEEALREIEVRLAHAMSLAQLVAWEYDVASGLFIFSDRFYAMHGTTAELEGGNQMSAEDFAREFVHPDDAHLVGKEIGKAVAAASPDYKTQLESRIFRRDGELRHVIVTISVTKDAAGRTVKLHGANQDNTERKELEAQMERLHTEHAAILDSLGEGVHWVDVDGRIKYENPAAVKMLGYEASDLLGKPAHATMHHTRADGAAYPQSECPIYATLRDGVVRRVTDEVFWRKDGSSFAAEYICTPVCGQNGRSGGSVVIFTDITERKRTQAQLENLQKQLVDASRQAGMAEIATNVLHNVGNVLNSVNISTGLIVQSVKKSRASSLARVVALLQEHAQDLGAFITKDLRGKHLPAHLAQLAEHLQAEQEANVRELELLRRNVEHIKEIVAMQQNYASFGGVKEMINVVDLVEDSLRLDDEALTRHEVEVVREFGEVPLLNVEKHKILQILVNLLRNAKHACQDSERADKQITVRLANGDGRVRISVIDNGVGIPPENLTRIFNHGFTTRKDGHGFGLHSSALAAKEMGGSLTVQSDGPGKGATFTLELPESQPAENTVAGNGQA